MKVVIVGLGTAGFSAILAIRKNDPKAEIAVIDEKEYDLLHSCGLPYTIEGSIKDFSQLKHNLNLKMMGVKLINKSKVSKINVKKKIIEYSKDNKKEKTSYDNLLICTGSRAFVPPINGVEKFMNNGVFVVDWPENCEKLKKYANKSKKAVVIGAGAIGLETSHALKKIGLSVTLIEMFNSLLPKSIDSDMSDIVEEYLKKKGIKVMLESKVKAVKGDKKVESVVVNKQEIKTDLVVIAAGVRANIELAKEAGVKAGDFGILTNEKMETNFKGVYAAGDCVQVKSLINQKFIPAQLATCAYTQGRIAGENISGVKSVYEGALNTFVTKIGDLEISSTGFASQLAESYGYSLVAGKVKGKTQPEWCPGGKEITVKIIADSFNGKILGCQAVGHGAASRINVVSTAIKGGFTLEKLSTLEMAYCPAVSDVYDPLLIANDLALRKFKQKRR